MPNGQTTALQKSEPGRVLDAYERMASPRHALTELQAKFPKDLDNPRAIREFYGICVALDLNPFLEEITVYQGRPYIEAAGWEKKISTNAPGQMTRCDVSIVTGEERAAFGLADGDILAKCTIVRRFPDAEPAEYTAYATVRKDEIGQVRTRDGSMKKVDHRPIDKEPWLMAMKRARVRAMRTVFRDTLTAGQDRAVSDEGAVDVTQLELPALPTAGDEIDDVPVRDVDADVPAPQPPTQATLADNLKQAAAAARGGFHARAKELGLAQSQYHRLLGLTCEGKHEDESDYDDGPPCRALSKWVARQVKAGDSEAGAWVRAREQMESRHRPTDAQVRAEDAEYESMAEGLE